jgi:predicted esterase
VARAEVPAVTELTTCAPGVRSPCDDGLEGAAHQRGCFGAAAGRVELQGKLLLPIVQRGAPPYLERGGGVELAGGAAVLQRQEEVCFAMTAPEGEAPAAGWPVLITAHGTGGSFRSHVDTLAPLVTGVEVAGRRLDMLTIGWDQVQHFTRRGDSTLDPEALVYNFGNPDAARGNVWQAAVDLHAVVRFVEELDLEVDGRRIKADPSQLYFLGHSQGGTSAAIALPYEPLIRGAVLSGTGAGLTLSLQGKTSPVDIPSAVAAALQDPAVGESHPVLNLLQGWFDPVDPLSYAEYIGARQLDGETSPRHVFALIGLGDTYSPQPTLEILATALRATLVEPLRGELSRGFAASSPSPVQGNASVGGRPTTVVARQYVPAAYDGHFVLFRHPDAQGDLQEFLSSALLGVPLIRD